MDSATPERRYFLKLAATAVAAPAISRAAAVEKEKTVTASEDLMREHGVLRRALLVYREAAGRLRNDASKVPADALMKTARLFRSFGEDYHERALEEKYIFPVVRKLKSPAAAYPDVLKKQHDRGREFTDYVMDVTRSGSIASNNAGPLAQALNAFELMYEHHTAREDTVVFVAWKDALSEKRYNELSDTFEQIERQFFGHDGFEDAVRQITAIESQFGLSDIAQFTIGPPPGK